MKFTFLSHAILALAIACIVGMSAKVSAQSLAGQERTRGVVERSSLSVGHQAETIRNGMSTDAARQQLYSLPLTFEKNEGQAGKSISYIVHSAAYSGSFSSTQVIFDVLANRESPSTSTGPRKNALVKMTFLGATTSAEIVGENPAPGHVNYFIGARPRDWHTQIPLFSRVTYRSLYPGTDLVFHGDPSNLEYDFALAPFADLSKIRMQFDGTDGVQVTESGDLVLKTKAGNIRFRKPEVYQQSETGKQSIEGSFKLIGRNTVGFRVGPYDRARALIVDPVLSYATYFPGTIYAMALDPVGNVIVAGAAGPGLPTKNPYQDSPHGYTAAFVTKFDPTGANLIFSTYIGGSGDDLARALAVDSQGNSYITGNSQSPDFPTTPGAFMTQCPGLCNTPFVSKFDPDGLLVYSTYTGGSNAAAWAIAADSLGSAYITGSIASDDLPVVNAFQPNFAGTPSTNTRNAFVQKLDPTGAQLLYSTYLGGGSDHGTAITVDSLGSAYVAGHSGGFFPVKNPLQLDVGTYFLTKFTPQGNGLVYSTLLGMGGEYDQPNAVAVDSVGNAYIAGAVTTMNYPLTLDAFDTSCTGMVLPSGADGCSSPLAYVVAMNSAGTGLLYSTFLGDGSANAITMDSSGNAYVAGTTASYSFPLINNIENQQPGAEFGYGVGGAFVAKLNSAGFPTFSTYLAGINGGEYASGIAVDADQNVVVAGTTGSNNFPVVNPFSLRPAVGFVAKVAPERAPGLSVSSLQPLIIVRNVSTETVSISNIAVASTTPGIPFSVTGNCGASVSLAPATQCFLMILATSPTPLDQVKITIASNVAGSPQTFTALAVTPSSFPPSPLQFSPSTLRFPPQLVSTASNPQTVTITNIRPETVTIDSVQASVPDFVTLDRCTGNLPSGVSCNIEVSFQPSQPNSNGTFGNLNITYSASFITGAPAQESLFLGAQPFPNPIFTSSPSQSFGSQYIGVPGMPRIVTLSNVAPYPVSLGSLSVSGPFSISKNCGNSLPAYGNCRVAVTFAPTQNGFASGNLLIAYSGQGSPANVALGGTGKIFSDLAISPLSVDFGPVLLQTTGGQLLTLTNSGAVPMTISKFTFTDAHFSQSDDCPAKLLPTKSCHANLTFTPTATNALSATLSIEHTGTGNPQIISLTGSGTTPLIFQPESLAFGLQTVGTTSAPLYLGVGNNSSTPITVQSISVAGDFQIPENSCPLPGQLAAYQGCNVPVLFTPTGPGLRTGTVTIMASDEPSPHIAILTGIGGTAPIAGLSVSNLYFSSQIVGSTSPAQSVTLSNTGNGSLNIAGVSASSGFDESNTCSSTLTAGSSCSIWATFVPNVAGQTTGTLTVTDDAPGSPHTVALWGNATDFSFGGTTAATVTPGQTATYNLQIAPGGGFGGLITLTCSGAPKEARCAVSPTSILLSGSESGAFVVTVTTTAPKGASLHDIPTTHVMALSLLTSSLAFAFLVLPAKSLRSSRGRSLLVVSGVVAGLLMVVSCGGGGGSSSPPPPGDPGTPAGTYTISTMAVSGGLSHTVPLSLTVK